MIEVGFERRDRIAYITLNRPEAKNAVTPEMHDEMCRLWANFRDDDQADVAILTGVGDAFCAGADLATYVPRNYVDASPSRVAKSSTWDSAVSPAACIASPNRRSPPSMGGHWPAASSSRWRVICAWLRTAPRSDRSRRGAGSITATVESRGWSTSAVSVWRCNWFLPPNRSTRIEHCNATWSRKLFRMRRSSRRRSCWLAKSCATRSGRCDQRRRRFSRSSASRWTISCG